MLADPHIWWYVTRASAVLAWILMTLSVVWGVLLSTRIMRKVDDASRLLDLHRYLGGLGLVMVALHVVSLMLDGWLQFSPLEALVPLQTDYRPIPVALGILALYLLIAVYGSSLLRDRLPPRFWKGLHYSNYAAVLLVAFHSGLSGTDVGRWWYLSVAVMLISLTAVAVVVRLALNSRRSEPVATATAPATRSTAVAPIAPVTAVGTPTTPGAVGVDTILMMVRSIDTLADGVRRLRLVALDGDELPAWEPGAHIALRVPGVGPRQYSLCGDPAERRWYDIAVLRRSDSTGGSAWVHDVLAPGMAVTVERPANHFGLTAAPSYLFIAGGIGITPILPMIESLPARRDWRLWYLGRQRSTMAFLPELLAAHPDRVAVYARDEHPARADVASVVQAWQGEVYACGPTSLIDALEPVVDGRRLHVEHFEPVARPARPAAPLVVECRDARRTVQVEAQQSVLEALESAGLAVTSSCRRGVCGSCEVRVLEGRPEHLDSVLPVGEADELGVMYPCVSRSLDARLVLDL
jgi:ferredoxin-NADP reductase/DMSO/TMAO reductase YedYZ heme-binding membrane subunit